MQSILNTSISSLFLTLTLLFGWLISDFRVNDAVNAVTARPVENASTIKVNVEMYPSTSSPNVDTNWLSGTNSGVSFQLPSAQARKDDEDGRITPGGVMGESYGTGGDI